MATVSKVPLDWAGTQNTLGIALYIWAVRAGDADLLARARQHVSAALEVYSKAGASHDEEGAKNLLAEFDRGLP